MPQVAEVIDCPYADCAAGVVSCGVGSLAENFHAWKRRSKTPSLKRPGSPVAPE